jgi:presenilin-like A22 family membrane protease
VTLIFGVYISLKLLPDLKLMPVEGISSFSLADIIYILIVSVLFFIFAFKFPKFGSVIYRVFLTLVILSMLQTVLSIWLRSDIALIISILFLVWFWFWQSVFIQDLVMIITLAGLGAILGLSLTPLTVIFVLVILSVYDIIAVYVTGHMVKMAKLMVDSKAIFGFVIPDTVSNFKTDIKNVRPGDQFMILGSGDVIMPIIFTVSLVQISNIQSLIVGIFSVLGLLATHLIFINQKIRRPMAALPPIAAMTIIGYLIASLLV